MNQNRMPLVEAITQYQKRNPIRYHVPGHKGRGEGLLASLYPFDLTEVPGLDDLHHPEEAIREAQQLAAEAFGAEETFFLIGGSTVGNLAMLLAACHPGDEVLVQRNAHKSVMNGLILAQAKPIYLQPEVDPITGLPVTVSLQELKIQLQKHPEAKAVFLTNPNYYGMGMNLRPYAELCEEYGIPLLVDEAHGAHLGLIQGLPGSAMQAGASAAVQSTHKMLPSLTMSSMLHVKGPRLNRERLRKALTMVQSSSPSYPLMASLDHARHYVLHVGQQELRQSLRLSAQLKDGLAHMAFSWLEVVEGKEHYDYLDPLKVTLRTHSHELHGFALREWLEQQGVFPELADEHHVLLTLSPKTTDDELKRTLSIINQLERTQLAGSNQAVHYRPLSSPLILSPYEVFQRASSSVPLQAAVGEISAEMITPYPPGIPLVAPGERLELEMLEYIQELQRMGCRFHGVEDTTLKTLKIIKNDED
ncbi:aminotransferase class I/II-fold pyridoxal phosphate-dependent enzyme [Ammoniphilus sp. YIM 78166]|uniref:aminotransferase class I/II-fold pyridoxal phosphate-dependent enzyme n=1 Tax=Ammoniphilus sp. YIM 78166 TaxID=1644106 RepID=UPI001F0F8D98|nr:aminotransferase class I/II-fold pyridoxal phosphate-dependent enzyme [Ammoniphilus sp. YIM 78166]